MAEISIDIERGEAGLFYGTSKAMKGLLIAGNSIAEVMDKAPAAIEEMRAAAAEHRAQGEPL